MTWLQFISSFVNAVAWPAVLVFLSIYWRRELRAGKSALRRVKFKDFEAEFREVLEEAKSANPPTAVLPTPLQTSFLESALAIADVAPIAAIPFAWQHLEKEIADTLGHLQGATTKELNIRARQNLEILRDEGYVSREEAAVIHDLRRLRNDVSHNMVELDSISKQTAIDYANQCYAYAEKFKRMREARRG